MTKKTIDKADSGFLQPRRRSRNACLQCKKRKVKCDEQAPCCRNCKFRQTPCSFGGLALDLPVSAAGQISTALPISQENNGVHYEIPLNQSYQQAYHANSSSYYSPFHSSSVHPSLHSSTHTSSSLVSILTPSNYTPDLAPGELELMHHYATTGFASLADYEVYKPVWQITVPQEMQSVNFLRHGILAISALHIHHLRSGASKQLAYTIHDLSHRELAQKHYHAAITEFGSLSQEEILSNPSAIFAFSHLTIFFAFGSAQLSGNATMQDPIGEMLDLFALTRKGMTFLKMKWDSLQKGNMGILLQRGPQITDRQFLPTDAVTALELVEEILKDWEPPTLQNGHTQDKSAEHDVKNTYRLAISQLWDSFVMIETKRKDWGMALRFPMICPEALFPFFGAREPLAMVILAYYCVLLHRAPMRWWADGWSTRVIQAIFQGLPQNWRYAISWPMSKLGLLPEGSKTFQL